MKYNYTIEQIANSIKNYSGIKRKKNIKNIINILGDPSENNKNYVTTFSDDSAAINIGYEELLLLATDGIWEELIIKSPWWAGFAAVLSNINDIYAMGGKPIAMVDVLSYKTYSSLNDICNGIRSCIDKFDVPIVGGHTHPYTSYDSISISIIGSVNKNSIIRSDHANINDIIIEAIDLNGKIGPNSNRSWVSILNKSKSEIKKLYDSVPLIGKLKLVTCGKDISNPGIIGTICMLCESSGVGATIDIEKILTPLNEEVDFIEWLQVHPSTGFVFTCNNKNLNDCINILESAGFSTSKIGTINKTKNIILKRNNEKLKLYDLNNNTLF